MTDEDMKQYLPLWREAMRMGHTAADNPITAADYHKGNYDSEFDPGDTAYQAIKLMAEGWKPETKEDVAREMLARAYRYDVEVFADDNSNDDAILYLARCLPDGIKIADLPEVEND